MLSARSYLTENSAQGNSNSMAVDMFEAKDKHTIGPMGVRIPFHRWNVKPK